MKPRIAIPEMGPGNAFHLYMKDAFAQAIRCAGGEVCWVDLAHPGRAAAQGLQCDALLLAGGEDVDPHLYGEEPIPACGAPNRVRDAGESAMLQAFWPTGKPVFAICRGVQMLNVCRGGTLHQDIAPRQRVGHDSLATRMTGRHTVTVARDTRLWSLWGAERVTVNSIHHQAVKTVAPGFVASAVSEDGFIEAIELPGSRFCMGVQWHPEHMTDHAQQRALFAAFLAACEPA